jgi:chemotaxis protein methyltransferase CheR
MLDINEREFARLTGYIKDNYGINLSKKKILVEGRLSNIIYEKGFESFGDYLDYVFADKTGEEVKTLINRLTTNHTFFMRESKHFEYFQDTVLPYLAQSIKDKDLRIWSAGCSTGEEPYTLQMIIQDYFERDSPAWEKSLLATDISTRALEIAMTGVYPSEAISDVPPMWKLNYFSKLDKDRVVVRNAIKNNVVFRPFNLMEEQFPFKKKFHTIFCRNVMIYFDRQTKISLVNRFYDALDYGGYLFIGHSESIEREATDLKYILPAVYRKLRPETVKK